MPGLASSFSLSEKRTARSGPDERNQTGILTSGFNLAPAFPAARADSGKWGLYPVTVAQPSPNHTGFPGHLIALLAGDKTPAPLSKNAIVNKARSVIRKHIRREFF
jgi:hypothetical protein